MRKWNNILVHIIIVLVFLHGLMGSLMLLGFSKVSLKPLSWILFVTVILHGVLGAFSTFSALKNGKRSGRWYLRQNVGFWTKRVSGFAILVLLVFHITAYTTSVDDIFFLKEFTFCKMILQIAFILAIFIHLLVSIKAMLIAKGTINLKERTVDWMFVLSIMILFFIIAVIAYYIQWQI